MILPKIMRAAVMVVAVTVTMDSLPAYAQSNNELTDAEVNVCQDLDMCVDILLRHNPESFDYGALLLDFQRFREPAQQRLLQLIGSDREMAIKHAQLILSNPTWRYSETTQLEIAKLWPRGDLETHGYMMTTINTPLMRDRVIATLVHPNAEVRAQSRVILAAMASPLKNGLDQFIKAPVPPAAYKDLIKAAADDPTPEILKLIGTFAQTQSQPVLRQFLVSEDSDIVIEAYAQLYKQSPDMALAEFKAALPNLKTNRQAIALSRLLQHRHVERERGTKDGFYMHLAHTLVVDKTLPPLAHIMAMDAIMTSAPLEGKSLPNTPHVQAVFERLVTKSESSFLGYAYDFEKKVGANIEQFLPVIWAEILRRNVTPDDETIYAQRGLKGLSDFSAPPNNFIYLASDLAKNPKLRNTVTPILRQGLRFEKDWRVQRTAALGIGHAGHKAAQAELVRIAQSHPIVDVRAAARSALAGIAGREMNIESDYVATLQAASSCPVTNFDFIEDAKQLPFFESREILDWGAILRSADRRNLTTAFPAKSGPKTSGWFAGYSFGEFGGGLIYYDNVSGKPELVSKGNIIAIVPVKPTPLGTYSSEFWVVRGFEYSGLNEGGISYVNFEGGLPKIRRHLKLRAAPTGINIAPDQSLQMAFGKTHPPLRLLPDGRLVDGCAALASGAPQSLPN